VEDMTPKPGGPDDIAVLRMFRGATFKGGVQLPSGWVLGPEEAQAFASAGVPPRDDEAPTERPAPRAPEADPPRTRPRRPRSPHDGRSPLDLYLAGGGNPGNAAAMALMHEANRGYERRRRESPEWHRDGIAWYAAPVPGRWHRCKPWSVFISRHGMTGEPVLVERCACGAQRRDGEEYVWTDRNSRRDDR